MEEIGNIKEYLIAALLTLESTIENEIKIVEVDKLICECLEYLDELDKNQ